MRSERNWYSGGREDMVGYALFGALVIIKWDSYYY